MSEKWSDTKKKKKERRKGGGGKRKGGRLGGRKPSGKLARKWGSMRQEEISQR
jgi:hypothetical protein